jgi:short-subunit dehydrogenase
MAPPRHWPTALVTGASAGIGRAFAERLASRGSDLVLVARDAGRLEALADELRSHGRAVEVLPADLTDPVARATVEQRLAEPDGHQAPVDLLVNNAGSGTSGAFHELPVDGEEREIELNVVALVRLTHAAVGAMRERRRGAVLNVSSLSAYSPVPNTTTYAATKAFVLSFSHGLRAECRGTGVEVMCLCPGYTHTEFQQRSFRPTEKVPAGAWHTADQVVDWALADLDRGRAVSIPGIHNKTGAVLARLAPGSLSAFVAGTLQLHSSSTARDPTRRR